MRHSIGANFYETYAVRSPLRTHYRKATCQEVQCPAYTNGWHYRIEHLTPELLYAALHSGRKYRQVDVTEGESYLVFEPGQICFDYKTHYLPLERPEFYFVGRGRGSTFSHRRAAQYTAQNWVDKFAEKLSSLQDEIKKG